MPTTEPNSPQVPSVTLFHILLRRQSLIRTYSVVVTSPYLKSCHHRGVKQPLPPSHQSNLSRADYHTHEIRPKNRSRPRNFPSSTSCRLYRPIRHVFLEARNGNRAERRSASQRYLFYRPAKNPSFGLCWIQKRRIAPRRPHRSRLARRLKVSRATRKNRDLFSVVDHIAEKAANTHTQGLTLDRVGRVQQPANQAVQQSSSFLLSVHTSIACVHDAYVARLFSSSCFFYGNCYRSFVVVAFCVMYLRDLSFRPYSTVLDAVTVTNWHTYVRTYEVIISWCSCQEQWDTRHQSPQL